MKEKEIIVIDNKDLMTARELAAEFPECGLTSLNIGYLCQNGAFKGEKPRHSCWLIVKQSFVEFLKFKESQPIYKITYEI